MGARQKTCEHKVLQLEPSPFAELAGFERLDARKRLAATTTSGRSVAKSEEKAVNNAATELSASFPGPLVLPHDDLNYDPSHPAQSLRSWLHEKQRNKPTQKRKTIYVASVPEITPAVAFMQEWIKPNIETRRGEPPSKKVKGEASILESLVSPNTQSVIDYLSAFYHGMLVKPFPQQLQWVPWGTSKVKSRSIPKFVGLGVNDKTTRIRVRPSPDGVFKGQLNLNDILDVAIDILPEDAYSIILLVDHDIHEDENDDYCCGRAYGGSRICVVQAARYHPILDEREEIDYQHLWPTSHCKDYVDGLCVVEDMEPSPATAAQIRISQNGPIRAAISAASVIPPPSSAESFRALWQVSLVESGFLLATFCRGVFLRRQPSSVYFFFRKES